MYTITSVGFAKGHIINLLQNMNTDPELSNTR